MWSGMNLEIKFVVWATARKRSSSVLICVVEVGSRGPVGWVSFLERRLMWELGFGVGGGAEGGGIML